MFTTTCVDLDNASERQVCDGVFEGHREELERVKREARQQEAQAATTTTKRQPPPPPPAPTFTDGLYKVGDDIKPGSYRTSGGGGGDCYYARLKTDDTTSYIANNLSSGPMRMTVRSTDGYVEFSGGCEWRKA